MIIWNKARWWILAWVKKIALWIPFMNRSFVILSSARSGSTYLTLLLDSHPKISCRKELLNRNNLKTLRLIRASSYVLVNYILASLFPWKFWLSFTGFKLFHEQLEFCNLSFKEIFTALSYPPVIVLFRENMLETYVSLKIAFKTRVWYSEDSNCSKENIVVDWQDFVGYVTTLKERWKRNMAVMPPNAKVIFVSYEELVAYKDKTMSSIFKQLNLEDCKVEASSKKQNPFPLMEKIINYEEIEQQMLQNQLDSTITKQWLRTVWIEGR